MPRLSKKAIRKFKRDHWDGKGLVLTSADKPICLLNLDLPPDFHEILWRNVEQVHRPHRIAEHQREQTQARAHQPPAPFGTDHRVPLQSCANSLQSGLSRRLQ